MTTDNTIGGPHIYYYRSRGSYIIVVLEYIITLEHKSWQSVFLVEETGVPGENHVLSKTIDKLYHIMLYIKYISPLVAFELTTLVIISTKLPNNQVVVDDKLKYKTVHYQIWPS